MMNSKISHTTIPDKTLSIDLNSIWLRYGHMHHNAVLFTSLHTAG